MKTKTLHLVSIFCTLCLTTILVLHGEMKTAFAQNPQSITNGISTPTAAQRFFEEGDQMIETEIEILIHPEIYSRDDILEMEGINPQNIQELEKPETMNDLHNNKPKSENN